MSLTVLPCQVTAELVAAGEADVLVDGEDDEPVQVALAYREVSQAGAGEFKRIEIQSKREVG